MPDQVDHDLEGVQKETGTVLTSFSQLAAMAVAFLPKRKAKVQIKKSPTSHPPPAPPPEYAHARVNEDIGYAQQRLSEGAEGADVQIELQGLSRRCAVSRTDKQENYLKVVIQRADQLNRTGGAKIPIHSKSQKPKR